LVSYIFDGIYNRTTVRRDAHACTVV